MVGQDLPGRVACPGEAEALYDFADGEAAVCAWSEGQGRVTLVNDASVWGNARLPRADNLAFALRTLGDGPVLFDEYRQGGPATAAARDLGKLPHALLGHVVAVYALAAWALSRPFGPRLRVRPEPRPASIRELLALAELHRRGKHAPAAGRRLLEIARARLRRRGGDGAALPEGFAGGERQLVELAARVGRLQQEGRL